MNTKSQSIGKLGMRLLKGLSSQNISVFSIAEAQELLADKNDVAIKQLLSRLVRAGWLVRLKRGKYLIVPLEAESPDLWSEDSFVLASANVTGSANLKNRSNLKSKQKDYAISYWSALNYYGYTEQIPRTVFIITSMRQKSASQDILDVPYRLVFLSQNKHFGTTTVWQDNKPVQITDKEKTIIDCLDHPRFCGGIIEAAKGLSEAFKDNIDAEKLSQYAHKIGNATVYKRLGFLSEYLELPVDAWINDWQKHISKGYSLLDPTQPKRGKYNKKWHLIINQYEFNNANKVKK